jgi:transcriptional regulator with XRE-family HTH domain
MTLAEECNTSASYIGEIEIGRKFPSVEMIEKIAVALQVEPYRLFMDSSTQKEDGLQEEDLLRNLPRHIKQNVKNRLLSAISADVEDILDLLS